MRSLTNRQRRFIQEYAVDLNATKAAVRSGYSRRTARQIGSENLSKPVIASEIEKCIRAQAEHASITVAEYVAELRQQVSADVADIFDEHGNLRPTHEWPLVWRRGLILSLRVKEERSGGQVVRRKISIRFANRTTLKFLLGKHFGAFG